MVNTPILRNDGVLTDAMATIANPLTGLGTNRDKSAFATPGTVSTLARQEVDRLYRNSALIRKVIDLLPTDAVKKWGHLSTETEIDHGALEQYEKKLRLRHHFRKAGKAGRLYGDHFIAIGVDDGLLWDEPVDLTRINSVQWLKRLSKSDLTPDLHTGSYDEPEFYYFSMDFRKWPDNVLPRKIHHTRLLRFSGNELPELALESTQGYHDSVLQAMYNAFAQYMQGLGASAAMLADYSVFSYGLAGLSEMLASAEPEAQTEIKAALANRFEALQMGMSTTKGLMHDAENEQIGFVNRSFGGVNEILERLLDMVVAESGTPRTKLLSSPRSGAFTESGETDRYEWAASVLDYQTQAFQANQERILTYLFAAKDGPSRGKPVGSWNWHWHDTLELTRAEISKIEKTHAETDIMRLRGKILHPAEVRESRYGGADYGTTITLNPEYDSIALDDKPVEPVAPAPAEPVVAVEPEPVRADQGDRVALLRADSETLALLRKDALDGLIPLKLYWQAAGLNEEEVSKLMQEQRDANSKGYWLEEY